MDTTTSKTDSLTSPSVVSLFVWHNTLVNPQRIGVKSYFYETVCASLLLATAPDVCDIPQFDRPTRAPSSRGAPLGVGGQTGRDSTFARTSSSREHAPFSRHYSWISAPPPRPVSVVRSPHVSASGWKVLGVFFLFFSLSRWPSSLTVRSEERRCIHFFFWKVVCC